MGPSFSITYCRRDPTAGLPGLSEVDTSHLNSTCLGQLFMHKDCPAGSARVCGLGVGCIPKLAVLHPHSSRKCHSCYMSFLQFLR